MAVMSKMRDKMHIVLYVLVGAFLITIVFEWGMNFSGMSARRGTDIGVVNGKPIPFKEFESLYRNYLDQYRQQLKGQDLDDQAEARMQEQVWESLVMKILLGEEYEKLGLKVTDEEITSEIFSDNPPFVIAQQFRNPETGKIDREKLNNAIADPRNKQAWIQVEQFVRQQKLQEKLQQLLLETMRATDAEARQKFDAQKTSLKAKYVLFDMSRAKPDSAYYVSEADIKAYFNEHREEYRQEPTREAKYVFFPTDPTEDDKQLIKKELEELKKEFETTSNDTDFVRLHSDEALVEKVLPRGQLPVEIDTLVFKPDVKKGTVLGPVQDFTTNQFKLIKITSVKTDGEEMVRASHILIKPNGNTKADTAKAIAEAKALMARLKKGEDFEKLAREKSADPGSAARGGDLNWFGRGRMVKPFEEACYKAKVGELVGPVQTQFGIHIIKVTGRDRREIKGIELVKKIVPSPSTIEKQRRIASEFEFNAREIGFDSAAQRAFYTVRETGIFSRYGYVPIIGYSNAMAQWGFKAKLNEISPVIQAKDGFVVMQLTAINDDGYRKYDEDLKRELKSKIIRERKMQDLRKLAEEMLAKCEGSLERAVQLDSLLQIRETGTVTLSVPNIQGIGYDPSVAAALSVLSVGTLSKPIDTNRGVMLAVLSEKQTGKDEDFEAEKATLRKQIVDEKRGR
ncbi:MAG: peptidylprolyl isomerase, partial [Chloroherpetonaceae bacterium]|nr:peptidylprolyl isomerase [Chloroherpetonaceae bacterium]